MDRASKQIESLAIFLFKYFPKEMINTEETSVDVALRLLKEYCELKRMIKYGEVVYRRSEQNDV